NARTYESGNYPDRHNAQAAASYVRGGHNVKFGFQNSWGPFNRTAWANADLYQNYLNGVPATVTLLGTPARWKERLNAGLAIYGQDAWTLRSEEHTSELQSRGHLVCRLLLEKKNKAKLDYQSPHHIDTCNVLIITLSFSAFA